MPSPIRAQIQQQADYSQQLARLREAHRQRQARSVAHPVVGSWKASAANGYAPSGYAQAASSATTERDGSE